MHTHVKKRIDNRKHEIVFNNMIFKIILTSVIIGSTCGFTVDEVTNYAKCMSKCQQKSCEDGCIQSEFSHKKVKVSTDAADFNASLHCRDVDLIAIRHNPGVYLTVMEDTFNTWRRVSVIEGGISIFHNLQPGKSYRYVVQRFHENIISSPEVTDWFNTTAMGITPTQLKKVYLVNISQDDINDDHLMADIALVPGEDRSCFYDVLSFLEDEGLSIGIVNATREFKFKLRNLEYHRNNTVIISAKNNGSSRSSKNVSLTFETPTCLQVHQDLKKCPPDPVTGLRVLDERQSDTDFDFSLSWNRPKLLPDSYTLQIVTQNYSNLPYIITVPGNLTGVSYSLENTGLPYIITMVAKSLGGTSTPVSIQSIPSDLYISSSVSYGSLIVFPFVTLIAALITLIYIYWRHKNMQNYRNPYRYCKQNFHGKTIFNLLYEKPKPLEVENKIEDDPLIIKDHFDLGKMQLRIKDILGSGFSGVVRRGSLDIDENKTLDVAVKMLRDCPSSEDIKNFQHEMMVMKSAGKHPNIVSLIRCCTSEIKPMLVVEYCSKGDLQNYLRSIWKELMEISSRRETQCNMMNKINRDGIFSEPEYENNQEVSVSNKLYDLQEDMLSTTEDITGADLLSFALQIANGMKFLSLNRIVHRDLAARNVLVCGDKTVKISDFGLSRDIYQDSVYKKQGDGKLPLKWMAIEALTHQIYTSQSDVWSFGILLWEIVTLGSNPYPDTPTHMILQVLKTGYRMERPHNCGKELYDIMLSCWHTGPRSRPTFTDLKHNLEKLLQTASKNEYLNVNDIHKKPRNTDTSA